MPFEPQRGVMWRGEVLCSPGVSVVEPGEGTGQGKATCAAFHAGTSLAGRAKVGTRNRTALLHCYQLPSPKKTSFSLTLGQIFCSSYRIPFLITTIFYYKNNSQLRELCACVLKGSRSMGIQGSVANAFGAPKGCGGDALVLQLLLSVQDRSRQGQFFSKVSAFAHGMLFYKVCRGKKVLANQMILAEGIAGQNWLKGYQNQSTSVSLAKFK